MLQRMFVAMKAFVEYNGKILLLREGAKSPSAGKFGVPGGRVEPGEHFLDCLHRELIEETGLNIEIEKPFFVGEWRPVVRGEQWHIVGTFFSCKASSMNVTLDSEHDRFVWINPLEYKKFAIMPPEDEAFKAYIAQKR